MATNHKIPFTWANVRVGMTATAMPILLTYMEGRINLETKLEIIALEHTQRVRIKFVNLSGDRDSCYIDHPEDFLFCGKPLTAKQVNNINELLKKFPHG
jgi:hypothetical protein